MKPLFKKRKRKTPSEAVAMKTNAGTGKNCAIREEMKKYTTNLHVY